MSKSRKVSKTKRRPRPKANKESPRSPAPDHPLIIDRRSALVGRLLTELLQLLNAAPPLAHERAGQRLSLEQRRCFVEAAVCNLLPTCPKFSKGLITKAEAACFVVALNAFKKFRSQKRDKLPPAMRRYLDALGQTRSKENRLFAIESARLGEMILGRADSEHSRDEWIELIAGVMAVQRGSDGHVSDLKAGQDAIVDGYEQRLARGRAIIAGILDLMTMPMDSTLTPSQS